MKSLVTSFYKQNKEAFKILSLEKNDLAKLHSASTAKLSFKDRKELKNKLKLENLLKEILDSCTRSLC